MAGNAPKVGKAATPVRCRTRLNFRHPHLVRGLWHVVVYMFVARGSGSPRAVSPFPVPCHAIHCQRELKGDHAADDAATDEKMASLFGQMGCPDKWEIYVCIPRTMVPLDGRT